MRILVGQRWQNGYLDPWKGPGERRITVRRWVIVEELDDLYVAQPFDVRRLIDYGREVGPVEVARKVMSRLAESDRNAKFAACGLGVDVENDETVAFFAPCVARCVERVVLPAGLVWPADEVPSNGIELAVARGDAFRRWSGWLRGCGRPLEDLGELEQHVRDVLGIPATEHHTLDSTPITEQRGESVEGQRLKASVFGYGHYVRSMVLSSLPPEIEVVKVHELDPLLAPDSFPSVDTCPHFRDDERPDVTFVAGFHHTHAPLAAEALARGSFVISEKPLATTSEQLDQLLDAWVEPSRYFAAFQRRFMVANDWVREDLQPSPDDPMSFHAMVHEVSLPERHWYHWPSSGSRMLSNGCHWVDHFLWLNDFAQPTDSRARRGPNGELIAELTLDNGAFFTLTLTDRGSDRLGVREHTELRVRDRTAVIEDMSSYVCEGPRGVLRREKFHRFASHRDMYQHFASRIIEGAAGDSRSSVETSSRTVLELEAHLEQA